MTALFQHSHSKRDNPSELSAAPQLGANLQYPKAKVMTQETKMCLCCKRLPEGRSVVLYSIPVVPKALESIGRV